MKSVAFMAVRENWQNYFFKYFSDDTINTKSKYLYTDKIKDADIVLIELPVKIELFARVVKRYELNNKKIIFIYDPLLKDRAQLPDPFRDSPAIPKRSNNFFELLSCIDKYDC